MGVHVNDANRHLFADRTLVAAAQVGDPIAMNALLTQVRPAITAYCRSRLAGYAGGADAADDAAQETCLAIFKVLTGYQDNGAPFAAWVYAIAANKVADTQRRFGRAPLLVDEIPEQVEPAPTPEELVLSGAHQRAAEELIVTLPERMAQILRLRAAGATPEAVGAQLGMTPGAVRVTHHRAVARLRRLVLASAEHRELFGLGHEDRRVA